MTAPTTPPDVAAIVKGLTKAQREALARLALSGIWFTASEAGASGMALTLLCTRRPPLVERRWTRWGSEGVKRGEGYEYRPTDAVRAALDKQAQP